MKNIPMHDQLEWLKAHTPISSTLAAALPSFKGVRLACSLHIDHKIIPLLETLMEKEAEVFLVTCNPTTVRDDVVKKLKSLGVRVEAKGKMTRANYQSSIQKALKFKPTHLCELGADLSAAWHENPKTPIPLAALEGTGSGISRLKKIDLSYPVLNWDGVPLKTNVHNRVMVGLVACHTFFATTQLTFHGKNILVLGYGPVGEGVCRAAKHYGGKVQVTEIDKTAADRARAHKVAVVSLTEGLSSADVVITATGAHHVIKSEHLKLLKENAFLFNVGHEATEIELSSIKHKKTLLPYVEKVSSGKRSFYLLANGSMFNLTAGEGDSLNSFDLIVGILTSGLEFLVSEAPSLKPGIHPLPDSAWRKASDLAAGLLT